MMFESKMPYVGTTIFTTMTQLAAEHSAINLGQGFPDFDADPHLLDLVTQAMREGHNQYPQMPGIKPLRDKIARSEEHTSELQSLMRISYAVFCLKTKNTQYHIKRQMKAKHKKKQHT